MTSINIPSEVVVILEGKASSEGLTLIAWLQKLALEIQQDNLPKPFVTSRGILKKYGPAPSKEEIDQNRREMWANFPREF